MFFLNSSELNSRVTPGRMGQITGHRLRFDPGDTSQGIFFVNGSATRVSVAGKNDPSELMFLVPASDRHRLDGDNDGSACEKLP